MFEESSIIFILGPGLSNKRRNVIKDRIDENGGEIREFVQVFDVTF